MAQESRLGPLLFTLGLAEALKDVVLFADVKLVASTLCIKCITVISKVSMSSDD